MKICKREGPCYVDYTMKNQMHTYIVSNTALALLLLAGYDRYFAYDLGWQPLHMAAAAACTGCNATGGSDCSYLSVVIVRSQADLKTETFCAGPRSSYPICDAELSFMEESARPHGMKRS